MTKYTKRRPKCREFPALENANSSDVEILQAQYDFLAELWESVATSGPDLFANLCFRRKGTSKMIDKFVPLSGDIRLHVPLARYDRHRYDQYFSPNLYARPSRKLSGVQMTRLGWCDVDEADPFAFSPKPSVVWETSPGRTQALWFWDRPHTPAQASAYSKALTYQFGGDKGGSAANKLLRLPGSFNHKPEHDAPFIPLLHFDPTPITARPRPLAGQSGRAAGDIQLLNMNPTAHDRLAVLRKYRSKLDASARTVIRHDRAIARDRSKWIFVMVAGLHNAGASPDEIASVVWASPYFRDKYGDDEGALENEISRIIGKLEGEK